MPTVVAPCGHVLQVDTQCGSDLYPSAMVDAFATGLGTALTFLVIALVRRWYAVDVPDGSTLEELKPVYRKWSIGGGVALIPLIGCCIAGLGLVLTAGKPPSVVRDAAGRIVALNPGPSTFWVAAMFLGFALAVMLLSATYRLLLGNRFDQWRRYELLDEGYDAWRFLATMNFGFVLFGAAMLLGPCDWTIRSERDAITFDPVLSLSETTRPDSGIVRIRFTETFVAPNGRVVKQFRAEVEYADGFVWQTKHHLSEADPEDLRGFVTLIAERSGNPMQQVPAFD